MKSLKKLVERFESWLTRRPKNQCVLCGTRENLIPVCNGCHIDEPVRSLQSSCFLGTKLCSKLENRESLCDAYLCANKHAKLIPALRFAQTGNIAVRVPAGVMAIPIVLYDRNRKVKMGGSCIFGDKLNITRVKTSDCFFRIDPDSGDIKVLSFYSELSSIMMPSANSDKLSEANDDIDADVQYVKYKNISFFVDGTQYTYFAEKKIDELFRNGTIKFDMTPESLRILPKPVIQKIEALTGVVRSTPEFPTLTELCIRTIKSEGISLKKFKKLVKYPLPPKLINLYHST
jgi:hypothetical protein